MWTYLCNRMTKLNKNMTMKRNTIILFWNPEVSSFKLADFQELLENMEYENMNWSI